MIPKIIHHIWLQGGIPVKYQDNFDKWDFYCNEWEHIVWDEYSLLNLCNDNQKEQYQKIDSIINKVNYLKYILMYTKGGIYTDLDTYPLKPINELFNETEIKSLDIGSKLSIRHPFNTIKNNKQFNEYSIIIPGRNTLFYYPNGDRTILLDNPVLISNSKNIFWLNLINFCEQRTNLKNGELKSHEYLPHEPYGPYGITDFVFNNFKLPYEQSILILPPTYLMGNPEKINDNTYIIHKADSGWD